MNKEDQQEAVETTVSSPSPILRLLRLDQSGGFSNQQTHPRKRLDSQRAPVRGCESENTQAAHSELLFPTDMYCWIKRGDGNSFR